MSIPQYPTTFPCPRIAAYTVGSDMGILRSGMENGRSRQRRKHKTMPQAIQMTFGMYLESLNMWQIWANQYAYEWFYCPAVTYATADVKHPHDSPIIVRFISDITWTTVSHDFIDVTVRAEMAPEAASATGEVGVWVIGRRPSNPATNVLIGGSPDDGAVPEL